MSTLDNLFAVSVENEGKNSLRRRGQPSVERKKSEFNKKRLRKLEEKKIAERRSLGAAMLGGCGGTNTSSKKFGPAKKIHGKRGIMWEE